MPDVRALLIDGVRHHLAQARGLARAERAGALAAAQAAQERLAEARATAQGGSPATAAARDTELAALARRLGPRLADRIAAANTAAHRGGPPATVTPWAGWTRGPVDRAATPGPLRIGRLELPGPAAVPALVPLFDTGHLCVLGARPAVDGVITGVLLRALGSTAPGALRLIGYDPDELGGGLGGVGVLTGARQLRFAEPDGLRDALDELVREIQRINEKVLGGEYPSVRARTEAHARDGEGGLRVEPWRLLVLLGDEHTELTRQERAQLDRVVRAGAACGVHVLSRNIPLPQVDGVVTVTVDGDRATVTAGGPAGRQPGLGGLIVRLDPPPPPALVRRTAEEIAERVRAGAPSVLFKDLWPERHKFWTADSSNALVAPVGIDVDGRLVEVTLGDHPPHALIGGPSGSGKTNVIYAWLGALAARYSPRDLELYLLDFKEGVSFARFAPGARDPSWLPHVRLVGVNVNNDREFGLAMLRFLGEELRRRAEAAKRHEVTKLAELRAEDPNGPWPRIVAVIDEFQVLVSGRDPLAREAADLLEDLARRGRSQGIHLVLASQEVSGIEALWGRTALVAQFTLRIALPKARRVLVEGNAAADEIPRFHAVINSDSGVPAANRIVRIPEASARETWGELQRLLHLRNADRTGPPRLFDGEAVPLLERAPDHLRPRPATEALVALLGEAVDVRARSARLTLPPAPGRNLAVLGTTVEEACAVLRSAALSLAAQAPRGARFTVACFDDAALMYAHSLATRLPGAAWVDRADIASVLADAIGDDRHFLILYAVDGAAPLLRANGGVEALRRVLNTGPERGTHVLGWWRGAARLREDLGGVGSRVDAIGAWLALDIHGSDLAAFSPQPKGPSWYPRPWRGLFFDRAAHRVPEVVIPYGLEAPQ